MFYASGVEVAPGGVELSPWRSQEVRGSPELQNGGLRARGLDDDFQVEAFFCQVWSSSVLQGRPSGTRRCQAGSMEVPGAQGKPRAPERWTESSRRGLDDDFQVEAFFC